MINSLKLCVVNITVPPVPREAYSRVIERFGRLERHGGLLMLAEHSFCRSGDDINWARKVSYREKIQRQGMPLALVLVVQGLWTREKRLM